MENFLLPNQVEQPPNSQNELLPNQVEPAPNPENDPDPNQAEPAAIPENAPDPDQAEPAPIPENDPAAIPENAQAPIPDEANSNSQNAPSSLSRAWAYFTSNWKSFWPPIPSVIGTKLGFRPPPLPSYTIIETGGRTTFNLDANRDGHFVHGLLRLHTFDAFTTVTTRHSTIACMFIPCQRPRFTLFISHGKDVDIGQKINFYYELSTGLQCNVFSYDYSGYGQSTGTPSEANMYADAEAALNALRANYNLTNPEIIIYGHQIGTAASTYLAARNTGLAGLILISPFMSGIRIAYPSMPFSFWFDCFPSIDRISSVRCRTIIIESENEEYYRPIDGHGEKLFANLHPGLRVELLRFQSGDDGVEHTCLARLQQFVTQEAGEVPGY